MQDINDLALKMQMRILMVSRNIKRQEVEPPVKVYAGEHWVDNGLGNPGIKKVSDTKQLSYSWPFRPWRPVLEVFGFFPIPCFIVVSGSFRIRAGAGECDSTLV